MAARIWKFRVMTDHSCWSFKNNVCKVESVQCQIIHFLQEEVRHVCCMYILLQVKKCPYLQHGVIPEVFLHLCRWTIRPVLTCHSLRRVMTACYTKWSNKEQTQTEKLHTDVYTRIESKQTITGPRWANHENTKQNSYNYSFISYFSYGEWWAVDGNYKLKSIKVPSHPPPPCRVVAPQNSLSFPQPPKPLGWWAWCQSVC